MATDNDFSWCLDVSALTEIPHETMMARWQQGLVTPMSPTINTFAKTDGSWWTTDQIAWRRVPAAADNDRLDFHHDRFGHNGQAQGPVQSFFGSPISPRTGER